MVDITKLSVFDIETTGKYATFEELQLKEPKMAKLWSKRCEFLRDRYDNNTEMSDSELYILKSGLHAEFAKVVCVSFGICRKNADGTNELIVKSHISEDELEVLNWTATMLNNSDRLGMNLAGHTIERFDIPFLFKRFLANGLRPPKIITTWGKKPWELTFFDVAKFWSNGTWQEGFTSLDIMATLFGHDSPKSVMQASRVHETFYEGKLEQIKTYCDDDVIATLEVIKSITESK